MDINGVSAIVTGGASGLGAATARLLAAKGAKVVIADIQDEKGRALADDLGGTFVHTDVTCETDGIAAVDAAKELGPVRVLINCAGVGWSGPTIGSDGEYASAHSLDAFSKILSINLIGAFNLIRLTATAISQEDPVDSFGGRGAIVNTASVAAFDAPSGWAAYAASKGGIVGMTLPIARDLSSAGIRVNTIAPGTIDTPIFGEGESAQQLKDSLAPSVLYPKRLGSPTEFASLALELVTNSYMNAETIRIDGGARI